MGSEYMFTARMVFFNSTFFHLAFTLLSRIEDLVKLSNLGLSIFHLINRAHARDYQSPYHSRTVFGSF